MLKHFMDNGYITIKFLEKNYNIIYVNINYILDNSDVYICKYFNNPSIIDIFKIKPTITYYDKLNIHINFGVNCKITLYNTQYINYISIDETLINNKENTKIEYNDVCEEKKYNQNKYINNINNYFC